MINIVDAHHHVWSLARGDYGWLTPALGPIHRDFTFDDYVRAAPQVSTSVLVQAAPTLAETSFLLQVARTNHERVGAVVGWIDLDAEDARDRLADAARDPLFSSVRPMLHDIDDPEWILRPRVMQSLATMASLGLRFDALVRPVHLLALSRMVEAHSGLAVVIDHAAKPDIAAGQWEPWASAMRDLALHPRVHCKLSGLITEAGPDWSVDSLSPYVDHVLAHFGAGRGMWGSDWPVVERNGGYDRWWQATQRLIEPLDDVAQAAILGGNARRFYGLAGATPQ